MNTLSKHEKIERNRREFLVTAGAITVGAFLSSACSTDAGDESVKESPDGAMKATPETRPERSVALAGVERDAPEADLMQAVKHAALSATNFSWLSQGDAVFIKPALNSGDPFPATTSPTAVAAMVELLKEKGAERVIIGDMSGIEHVKLTEDSLDGSSRELMESSGIAQVALDAGAELYFPEEQGWDAFVEELPREQTHWQGGIMMPEILQDVAHIVLIPRCSRHILLGSSLGMKCAVGYWRTDTRLEYHRYAATIQEKTADANTVPSLLNKQRLVINDASQMITTLGPDYGFIVKPETGLIIASQDIVAHDMVALAWLLRNHFAMSEDELAEYRDPYTSQFLVRTLNRIVVTRLGNVKHVLGSEKLTRHDLDSIWDDRVLNRAYEIFGGVPQLNLLSVNDTVPEEILLSLEEMVTLSS
jgi:uncharacterized protein (DUF362 family)